MRPVTACARSGLGAEWGRMGGATHWMLIRITVQGGVADHGHDEVVGRRASEGLHGPLLDLFQVLILEGAHGSESVNPSNYVPFQIREAWNCDKDGEVGVKGK